MYIFLNYEYNNKNTIKDLNTMTNSIPLAERYKIYNSIDTFKPFQIEIMEKLAEMKKVATSISTGIGKTTMMKYLSLDFIDLNPNENKCLILVNTRALTFDIGQSIMKY